MPKTKHSISVFNPETFKILLESRTNKWDEAYKAWGEATVAVRDAPTLTAVWKINHLTYKEAHLHNNKVEEIVFEENSTKKKHTIKATN